MISKKFFSLLPAFLVGLIFRVYRFTTTYGFFGDQGQDLLAINNWIRTGQIPMRGILTSIGSFHMGPLYYYLIYPFVLIFQGQSIAPVYLFLIAGLALIIISFLFGLRFLNLQFAFVFSFLVAISAHLIFISKGAYLPNLQVLDSLLMLFLFFNYFETKKYRDVFLTYFFIGIGLQIHYTFLANLLTISMLFVILARKRINLKFILLATAGFLITLTPFFVGQFSYNFEDFKGIAIYLLSSKQSHTINFIEVLNRIFFPFTIYFADTDLPWYVKLFLTPLYLIILLFNFYLAFGENEFKKISRVVLLFYFTSVFICLMGALNFWWWYFDYFSVSILILTSIFITSIFQKNNLFGFLFFSIFIFLSVSNLSNVYKLQRLPQIVDTIANVILKDTNNSYSGILNLYVSNVVSDGMGFEYRYILEKNRIKTETTKDLNTANYVIVENNSLDLSSNKNFLEVGELNFYDQSMVLKSAEIYKKI